MAEMKDQIHGQGATNFAYTVIAHYDYDPALDGLSVVEASKKLRGSDSLTDQI